MNPAGRPTIVAAVLVLATCLTASLNGLAQDERPKSRLLITHYGLDYRGLAAGEENVFQVRVTNAGPDTIKGIRLSVTAPKGWVAVIEPATLDLLGWSSASAEVRMTLPASAAGGQRHTITCTAESAEVREATAFGVDVRPSPRFWRAVGAALALVVVAGLILVYLRYGRG